MGARAFQTRSLLSDQERMGQAMRTGAAAERSGDVGARIASAGRDRSRRRFMAQLAALMTAASGAMLVGGCEYPASAESRVPRVPRIGYLDPGAAGSSDDELAGFQDELRERGHRAFELDARYSDGDDRRLADLADELIRSGPHVILAFGTDAISAAKARTATVPIVMAASSDPVGTGLIESLAQPGGNVTGLTSIAPQLTGKRLQLLTQAFPEVRRVAYLVNPNSQGDQEEERQIIAAHRQLGVDRLLPVAVTAPNQLRPQLEQAVANGAEALVTFASGIINRNPLPIVEFMNRHRLPAMYAQSAFVVQHGGLMAYGPDYGDMYRRAAVFVDKILRGRTPADLPVERPRRFTLLVNRKAVEAQGLVISRPFLAQVDEVVEA